MSQPKIFVSYSHQDSAFTQHLVTDLRAAGAEVWYDVSGIDHGDFMQRIDEALRQCEWLVLVLTPAAI
ncbi:MAG TPA: toll/interleukin-1 receptor domain-containing protein, partial [Ktedonobacterales bacterium]|nr:toll/interleukin-1 receptor domain-containing protein [Ktedonobacterales bacterium]